MTPAVDITIESVPEKVVPAERRPRIQRALEEVELIEKGLIPRKSARSFLEELRKKKKIGANGKVYR